MPYSIVESKAQAFINEDLKLPRYQRKQTWGAEDNFKLCVSIFKGYPIGVVIINYNNGEGFLLDGRQRKNALFLMKTNPVEVYFWAKKFLGLKDSDTEATVRDKFIEKVNFYLQDIEADKSEEFEQDEAIEEGLERSISTDMQSKNLEVLISLILLIHGKYKGSNSLVGHFKFDGIIPLEQLEYAITKNGETYIDNFKLKLYIKYLIDSTNTTKEKFTEHLIKRYNIDEKNKSKIEKYVDIHWEYFNKCFTILSKAENIIDGSQIGIIRIDNARTIDAQNIFSLINKEGQKLTPEELLSARPFWNKPIKDSSDVAIKEAKKLYDKMGITPPSSLVYWDVCATFITRIDPNNLLFKEIDDNNEKQFSTKITLGFKLFSGILNDAITGISVSELEKKDRKGDLNFDWNNDVEKLVSDFNNLIALLYECEYFKYLASWKQSIASLLGDTIAMEYAILLHKNWVSHGSPLKHNQTALKKFYRDALILLDKLIYEYLNKRWAGSSFGNVANDLKPENFYSRFEMIDNQKWNDLLNWLATEECDATKGGKKAILYHYYCLKKMLPLFEHNKLYEMDHIFAQRQFDTSTITSSWKDNLYNFALLPKKDNISKSDRTLNDLKQDTSNTWLFDEVKRYTEISDSEIEKYSNINNISDLIQKRKSLFIDAFTVNRLQNINQ